MTIRRAHVPGGRKIRHVVLVTPEEEATLQAKSKLLGITVSRLLMESAVGMPGDNPALLLREVAALRRDVSDLRKNGDFAKFESTLANTNSKLMEMLTR